MLPHIKQKEITTASLFSKCIELEEMENLEEKYT